MEEFPQGMKTWIDQDTIVYLLVRDPHDREGELVAVGLDLPTGAVKNYELAIDDNGQAGIALYSVCIVSTFGTADGELRSEN